MMQNHLHPHNMMLEIFQELNNNNNHITIIEMNINIPHIIIIITNNSNN